ncbi:MAG: zinc ribbon domain-containing protein [Cyanobacteria bacterium J06649_5]
MAIPMNAAAYQYTLSSTQTLYLGRQGLNTVVTVQSHGPGQQQQSSQQFATGKWTAVPVLYALGQGVVIVIATLTQTYYLQVQGQQTQMSAGAIAPELAAQIDLNAPLPLTPIEAMPVSSMPSMQPMQPMQPMQMGMNPMSMKMGDMAMSMGSSATGSSVGVSTSTSAASSQSGHTPASTPADTAPAQSVQPAQSEPSQPGNTDQKTDQKVKRFCPQCGSGGIQPGDRFCAYCGKSL